MAWLSRGMPRSAPPQWWVIDDFFPNLLTGFRVAEYNALLRLFPGLQIASTYDGFDAAHAQYAALYPELAARVRVFRPAQLARCPLVYLNFLNNADAYLPHLQHYRVPFVMTLYPGGGFGLYEAASDTKLARVLASPLLREVIVTQSVTREYVRARARPDLPITEIFGVVADAGYFDPLPSRQWFGDEKPVFDIAFVAEKYMPNGLNKGFAAFVQGVSQARARLQALWGAAADARLQVHVVGSFAEADWVLAAAHTASLTDWARPVIFHGRLETSQLRALLRTIDLVVSPNLPGALHPGNFDGFPTGCCVEAALSGAAFAATDLLKLSEGRFVPGEHYQPLMPGPQSVAQAVVELAQAPQRLAEMARAGQSRAQQLFSPAVQIDGRAAVLARRLGLSRAPASVEMA